MSTDISLNIPKTHLRWNMYGDTYQNLGREGRPERVATPNPGKRQILVRIDSVGICYSDVKLLRQGGHHPKLAGQDLDSNPTRPGHEVCFTVVSTGEGVGDQYQVGQRYAIQPEVILNGQRKTYGFSIPGGLTQYQLIGSELLDTDQGASILKLDQGIGYAEASLLEPWGSVLSSYAQNRRLYPKKGGILWIIGNPDDSRPYLFSKYLNYPEQIFVSDLQEDLGGLIRSKTKQVVAFKGPANRASRKIIHQMTSGRGVDDIILLEPNSSQQVEDLLDLINPGGLINLVGQDPLDGLVELDLHRIHYHYVALVGNDGLDIADSYGPDRNRSDLKKDGTALYLGGCGPMGQMHLQRAITAENGPGTIVVCEVKQDRIEYVQDWFRDLADINQKKIHFINAIIRGPDLKVRLREATGRSVVDDVVVLVPTASAADQAVSMLDNDSLINFFAGTPAGIKTMIDLSWIYLGNLQITGTSGLGLEHIKTAYQMALDQVIDINSSVAAVGGILEVPRAIRAAEERIYPGKVVIYPQLVDLPLKSIHELAEISPGVRSNLSEQGFWTRRAEQALFEMNK